MKIRISLLIAMVMLLSFPALGFADNHPIVKVVSTEGAGNFIIQDDGTALTWGGQREVVGFSVFDGVNHQAYETIKTPTYLNNQLHSDSPSQDRVNIKTVASCVSGPTMYLSQDGKLYTTGGTTEGYWSNQILYINNYSEKDANISDHIVDLKCGINSPVILRDDGTVWIYNLVTFKNENGQPIDLLVFNGAKSTGLKNIVSISMRGTTLLAIDKNGDVWVLGGNDYGQAGIGSRSLKITIPQKLSALSGIKQVSTSYYRSSAVSTDGQVWIWGSETLMDPSIATSPTSSYKPLLVAGLNDVNQVQSLENKTLALKTDGTLWYILHNNYVKQVKDIDGIESISSSRYSTLALKKDGTVWSFSNEFSFLNADNEARCNLKLEYGTPTSSENVQGQSNFEETTSKSEATVKNSSGDNTTDNVKSPSQVDSKISSFRDLKPSHWSFNVLQWAIGKQIVSGYEDNTIRPDKNLTEAEFLAMLQRAFPNSASTSGSYTTSEWYDKYFHFAQNLDLPVKREDAESDITRGKVAQIIAYGLGQKLDIRGSVNYLLDKKLSNGKMAPTYEGFKADDVLTRAECLAFIKNLMDKGITSLQRAPTSTPANTSTTRIYTNTRFGFSIAFPNTWEKEKLPHNGDGAAITGPNNGEQGEFSAPTYTFTVSGRHYIENYNDPDTLYLEPDGPYKYNHYSTVITIDLNDGTKAKVLISGDGFPTTIEAQILQDDIIFTMIGTIGDPDSKNYEKIKEQILNTIKTFHLQESGGEDRAPGSV